MRPLAALTGIVMGSAVALLTGLIMVLAVFLMLPEYQERLSGEYRPLLQAIAWAVLLTCAAVVAFLGQIKTRRWRGAAMIALALVVLIVAWVYWP
jgi:predicted membrane protein